MNTEQEYLQIALKYVPNLTEEQADLVRKIARCKVFGGEITEEFAKKIGADDQKHGYIFMKTDPKAYLFCRCSLCWDKIFREFKI